MVKRALLTILLLGAVGASGAPVYQIDIVKEKLVKKEPPKMVVYKVKRGDTLLKIMKKYNLPRKLLYEVAKLNNIKDPNLIYAGQVIKLPKGRELKKNKVHKRSSPSQRDFEFLRLLGAKVEEDGYIFTQVGKVSLRESPLVRVGEKRFIVDFNESLSPTLKKSLEDAGFSVVGREKLDKLLSEALSTNFTSIQKDGKLILGEKDILSYKYDYLGHNRFTGQRTVINTRADTPKTLVNLLNSYGIAVIQPLRRETGTQEGKGLLKIVSGDGLTKINSIVKLLTGKSGKENEYGLTFPDFKLYVVYDFVTPEERVKLELSGNRVVVLTGNLLYDLENILALVPLANKEVELLLYEPPLSKGDRSKLTIRGLLVSTPKRDWFLIDGVDKPEELPYLRFRGVNIIIY